MQLIRMKSKGVASRIDISAKGFLEFMRYIRTVLVQDAVCFSMEIPNHPILKHETFKSEEFEAYLEKLKVEMRLFEEPSAINLEKINDGIFRYLENQFTKVSQRLDAMKYEANRSFEDIKKAKIITTTTTESKIICVPDSDEAQLTATLYKMDRNLTNVHDVWGEYKYGINGNRSVLLMNKEFNCTWRKSDSDRKHNSRRMKIVNRVFKLMESGMSEQAAVKTVEAYKGVKSLRWLAENMASFHPN